MDHTYHAQQTYALDVGAPGCLRLDLQSQILKDDSEAHLKNAGLSAGQTVWDIGCGNGTMLPFLAKAVGPSGHIFALDQSEAQLLLAKKRIAREGITNVTFMHGDIQTMKGVPQGKADLVHMRFVLMHVQAPCAVLTAVRSLLKEGGVAVSQESLMSTSRDFCDNPFYHECINALVTLGVTLGVDYDVGIRLSSLYKEAGYEPVTTSFSRPQATLRQVKEMLILGLGEWQKRGLEKGVMSQDQIQRWMRLFQGWPDDGILVDFPTQQGYAMAWNKSRPLEKSGAKG